MNIVECKHQVRPGTKVVRPGINSNVAYIRSINKSDRRNELQYFRHLEWLQPTSKTGFPDTESSREERLKTMVSRQGTLWECGECRGNLCGITNHKECVLFEQA